MRLDNLKSLYTRELQDLRDAEDQLIQMLPRMADSASDQELKDQLQRHGEEARKHKDRLDGILEEMDAGADDVTCDGMRGILREAEKLMEQDGVDDAVMDAALVAVTQKTEHYEMASYGTLRTFAGLIGDEKGERLLSETLEEESRADERLTRIARKSVNPAAKR